MCKKIWVVSILFFSFISGFAQQKDFQTWVNAEFSGELFNKIDIEIVPEIRIANNSSFVKSLLTDFDLSYPLNDYIRFGAQYRLEQKNTIEDISYIVNRFGIYGRVDFQVDKFRFNYRTVYQQEYEGINHRENSHIPFLEHRHRLAVSYYKKSWKLRPSLSYELFLQAKQHFFTEEFTSRLSAGVKYKVNKKLDFALGYKLQKEYFESDPLTSHILSVGFSYAL